MGRMTKQIFLLASVLFLLLSAATHAKDRGISLGEEKKRVALVIGNADYRIGKLKNPVNDARDISAKLKKQGFEVTRLLNADQRKMEKAIKGFSRKLGSNTIGLFYFAGHGMEVQGQNYLIPVGSEIEVEEDVKYEAVNAGRVLNGMEKADNGLNIVVLDACRNNPFGRKFRSASRGLSEMRPASGSLILYATEPGKLAQDGDGRNGIFTQNLLKTMDEPGLTVEEVFKKTALAVNDMSNGKQRPWYEGLILGQFYFLPPPYPGAPPVVVPTAPAPVEFNGHLQVNVNVSNARVSVDGSQSGTASLGKPLNLENIPVGHHRIRISARGYQTWQETTNVQRNQWTQVIAELKRMKKVAYLTIRSNVSGDNIILNGKAIGPTSSQVHEIATGEQHVRVDKPGYQVYETTINLNPGESRTINVHMSKKRTRAQGDQSVATNPEMVKIKGGCFQKANGKSACVDDFQISKYEVTQHQWYVVMGNSPSKFIGCKHCPVETVSWNDVQDYINKLNKQTGYRYRLPSQRQWVYACLGGQSHHFCGDNNLSSIAWYDSNSNGTTHPVGQKQANAYGLYDMSGNVREFTCWSGKGMQYDKNCNYKLKEGNTIAFSMGSSWADDDILSYYSNVTMTGGEPVSHQGFRLTIDTN